MKGSYKTGIVDLEDVEMESMASSTRVNTATSGFSSLAARATTTPGDISEEGVREKHRSSKSIEMTVEHQQRRIWKQRRRDETPLTDSEKMVSVKLGRRGEHSYSISTSLSCPSLSQAQFKHVFRGHGNCMLCGIHVTGVNWAYYECPCCGSNGYCIECLNKAGNMKLEED